MSKPENPPAFPENTFAKIGDVAEGKSVPGMPLRDYFASDALKALMSSEIWVRGMDSAAVAAKIPFKEYLAMECYSMADEMLKQRIKE